jgi:hypothetical protein
MSQTRLINYYPGDLINKTIAPTLHELNRKPVLGINDPNEAESLLLQLVDWDIADNLVCEGVVGDGHPPTGVRGGQLPRRVHHNYVVSLRRKRLLGVHKG